MKRRWLRLDKGVIAEVFENNYEWFKRYLRRRFASLNDYDAEDIVQQAAANLVARADIAGIGNLTSYIYSMLHNGAKDHYRKRKKEAPFLDKSGCGKYEQEQKVLVAELKAVVEKALNSLDEKQRFVFVETQLKGKSYEELVNQTGEKLGTLLSRKSRAAKKVKEIVESYINEEDEK